MQSIKTIGKSETDVRLQNWNQNNKLAIASNKDDERNYLEAIALIVDDSFELSSQNPTDAERLARSETWARVLMPIVPEERLQDTFDRAFADHDSNFPVNAYELKTAWEKIKREEKEIAAEAAAAERVNNPVANCVEKHLHVDESGMVEHIDPLTFSEFILLPCKKCRETAYDLQRQRHIEKNKASAAPPVTVQTSAGLSPFKLSSVTPLSSAAPSASEIDALLTEHNELVTELVEDEAARKDLLLVWDEGGMCFKLPHRADRTFTLPAMKRKIADYRTIRDENLKK